MSVSKDVFELNNPSVVTAPKIISERLRSVNRLKSKICCLHMRNI